MSVDDDLRHAVAHHQAGRLDRAESLYRKVLRREPEHVDALHLLGVLEFGRGRPADAVRLIRRATAANPDFAPAQLNLGNALNASGDPAGAEAAYRRAIELAPQFAAAHVNLAMLLNDRSAHKLAEQAARAALAIQPGLLEAHITLAMALRAQRRLPEAEAEYRKAVALQPGRAETLSDLGALLAEMGRFNEALERHHRALSIYPDDPRLHGAQGSTLALMGDLARAEQAFGRVLAVNPLDFSAWLLRGGALAGLGRFAEAKACYDRVLAADQNRTEAHWRLSLINALPADTATHLATILANASVPAMPRVFAGFALAHLHDTAGRAEDAFAAAAEANRLFLELRAAANIRFDPDGFDADIARVIAATGKDTLAATASWGDPSEAPIFLVGMPRAGGTLVEQILAGHPDIHAAGNLSRIAHVNAALTQANSDKPSLAEWDADLARNSAQLHIQGLAAIAGGKPRVLDATPDNILQLGLIAALFPNARVIICRRDAGDVILSNFLTLFVDGNLFSRDLAHCARRLRAVDRLTAHWRDVLALRMHDLSYEALVADPEAETRRLLDFLGLPWHPACLDVAATQRAIITPAAWDARQPITASRVGRWRACERHIAPFLG